MSCKYKDASSIPRIHVLFCFLKSSVVACTDNTSAEEAEAADSWDFPVLIFYLCSNKESLSEDQRVELAAT